MRRAPFAVIAVLFVGGCGGGATTIIKQAPRTTPTTSATVPRASHPCTVQASEPAAIKAKGQVTCEDAVAIVTGYMRAAPRKAQGSGAFLNVGSWTCHS